MSLDQTYEALVHFEKELREFNEVLRVSRAELQSCHAQIDALWRDQFRHTYDTALQDLEQSVDQYARSQGERYEQFIRAKLRQLESYLSGVDR